MRFDIYQGIRFQHLFQTIYLFIFGGGIKPYFSVYEASKNGYGQHY